MDESASKLDLILKLVNLTPTKLNKAIFMIMSLVLFYGVLSLFQLYETALIKRAEDAEKENDRKDIIIANQNIEIKNGYGDCETKVRELNQKYVDYIMEKNNEK